jgi:hypothetical protein
MKLVLLTILTVSQAKYSGMRLSDRHLKMLYQIPTLRRVTMEMSKDMKGGGGLVKRKAVPHLYPVTRLPWHKANSVEHLKHEI